MKKIIFSSWTFFLLLIGTVLFLAAYKPSPYQALERSVLDLYQKVELQHPPQNVTVIAIDDQTFWETGSWPWPRSFYAETIQKISSLEPESIGFFMLFPKPQINPGLEQITNIQKQIHDAMASSETLPLLDKILKNTKKELNHDRQLVQSLQNAENVILPIQFIYSDFSTPSQPLSEDLLENSIAAGSKEITWKEQLFSLRNPFNAIRFQTPRPRSILFPFSQLQQAGTGLGHMEMFPDQDGVMRRIPLLMKYKERFFPSFALRLAMTSSRTSLEDLRIQRDSVTFNDRRVPTDIHKQMTLSFTSPPDVVSFSEVLQGDIDPLLIKDRIVLIGNTARSVSSHYITPLGSSFSEVMITAQAVQNISSGQIPHRPPWLFLVEILAILYFAFFLVFIIPRVNMKIGALILSVFLITWLGIGSFMILTLGYRVYLLAPVILTVIGFLFAGGKRITNKLRQESIELNKMLGLQFQSQGMLDMALEKFMKCPVKDTPVRELLYNLGLDFERKRMFNKAIVVFEHLARGGKYKDVPKRIKRLHNLGTKILLGKGGSDKEVTMLLDSSSAKPTLGRYEVLEELGQGAMGTVYLGRDPKINREVAIKTLRYEEVEKTRLDEVKGRFFREAEAAGTLSHTNIITIYDVGEDHDLAYMAMELLKGTDLAHHCDPENLLSPGEVLQIAFKVADALDYAHKKGVVHRDIKPTNIMMLEDQEVKVTDFGIARVMSSSETKTGVILGTPNYMSPEQVAGKKVDGRSDLFSLGTVLYELFCGEKPFKGDSITNIMYAIAKGNYTSLNQLNPDLPACCIKLVDKLLSKNLTGRYQNAKQVKKSIQDCLDSI